MIADSHTMNNLGVYTYSGFTDYSNLHEVEVINPCRTTVLQTGLTPIISPSETGEISGPQVSMFSS